MLTLNVVVAVTREGGIGLKGQLPWKIKKDMDFFKTLTKTTSDPLKKNAVIMGRKTWESIPAKYRPLQGRVNIVLTRNRISFEKRESEYLINDDDKESGSSTTIVCDSLDHALECLNWPPFSEQVESAFIIGGSSIYQETLKHPLLDKVYVTRVEGDYECDVFVQIDEENLELMNESEEHIEGSARFRFLEFRAKPLPSSVESSTVIDDSKTDDDGHSHDDESKQASDTGAECCSAPLSSSVADPTLDIPHSSLIKKKIVDQTPPIKSNEEEKQYLQLIQSVIDRGVERPDRTGVGTLALFGSTMRFSLRNGRFPLLTTKKVFWRGVAEELLWFIRGSTDSRELSSKKIRIWDGNGSREFLDSRGLKHYREGDLGPVYGFQWRHFGAEYRGFDQDYHGEGVDQLAEVIETIRNNPYSRRIVMSAWNPADLSKMALPPCHMFCQFFVANGELSCQMYQRSADMGLGVPFNIASYALMTRLIAQVCGLEAGDFVHCIGDTHVYLNHVDPLKEQLKREPRQFPTLKINPNRRNIDDFVYDDFQIVGYKPYPKIAMKMAV